MEALDINFQNVTQLIESSSIPNAFGISANSFLTLILGSFIVGYFGLTFYYKIYHSNGTWKELEFSEKAIVSLVVGFLTIILSECTLAIMLLISINYNNFRQYEQMFSQYPYVLPFFYFIAISIPLAKSLSEKRL